MFNFDGFSYSDTHYSASGNNANNIMIFPLVVAFHGNEIHNGKVAAKEGSIYVTYTDLHKIILSEKSGQLEKY